MNTDRNNFIEELLKREDDSVKSVMAFMSYNPSIGRVLEKGGVKKFQKMMLQLVDELPQVHSQHDFDNVHDKYTKEVIKTLKTSKTTSVSYGQAQKPINVFLKIYVDWARKPNEKIRSKLLPFLNVPLDSILMKTIKKKYQNWYKTTIEPLQKSRAQEFSLSKIDQNIYMEWQNFFRGKYPTKPLIFDIVWAINR